MSVSFCTDCLDEAVDNYGVPEILNTNQGSQFTSDSFIEKVSGHTIRLSMDGKGRATDNVCIERFWKSIKYEQIYLHSYSRNMELFLGITAYVDFYNNQRKHQSLHYQTPSSVYIKGKEADNTNRDNSSKKKNFTFEKTT